jgi:hypothetical protein
MPVEIVYYGKDEMRPETQQEFMVRDTFLLISAGSLVLSLPVIFPDAVFTAYQ